MAALFLCRWPDRIRALPIFGQTLPFDCRSILPFFNDLQLGALGKATALSVIEQASVLRMQWTMIRVEMHDAVNAFLIKLQGRFTGDDAEHVRSLVTRSNITLRIVVDLTDITFVDDLGESALQFFGRMGAEFIATNSYALDICERLHLPLATSRKGRVIAPPSKLQAECGGNV